MFVFQFCEQQHEILMHRRLCAGLLLGASSASEATSSPSRARTLGGEGHVGEL